MTQHQAIYGLHANCGCLHRTSSANSDEPALVTHDDCRLLILGLCLVISCDKCSAFGSSDSKPDLLILRKVQGCYEWLVVEVKAVMNKDAIRQDQAGIYRITNCQMFSPLGSAKITVLYANKKANRTANVGVLRRKIEFRGRNVSPRLVRCGSKKQI